MNVKWPNPIPEGGRLSSKEVNAGWASGYVEVVEPTASCQQTLNISLFRCCPEHARR